MEKSNRLNGAKTNLPIDQSFPSLTPFFTSTYTYYIQTVGIYMHAYIYL